MILWLKERAHAFGEGQRGENEGNGFHGGGGERLGGKRMPCRVFGLPHDRKCGAMDKAFLAKISEIQTTKNTKVHERVKAWTMSFPSMVCHSASHRFILDFAVETTDYTDFTDYE